MEDPGHWLFVALLAAMVVSAFASLDRRVAFAFTLGFALLTWAFVFGSEWLAERFELLTARLLPLLAVGSSASFLYAVVRTLVTHQARGITLFAGENGLGTLTILCGGVTIGYLSGLEGRWRYLVIPYSLLTVAALLACGSRGAWLGFVTMAAALGSVNRRLRWWAATGVVALILILALSPAFSYRFLAAFDVSKNMSRVYIYRSTLNMIRDHPWIGVGAGVFGEVYPHYILPGDPDPGAAFAHNLLLQVAAEFGILGLTVFVVLLGRILWVAGKLALRKGLLYQGIFAALVGTLVHQQVDIPIWGFEIGGAFWILCGLVLATHARERRGRPLRSW
ncbi:MAG: O-antigen ligase family protein [Chitinophagales bacterium]